ncbi:MAG: flagellar hook-length control protein FliK [Pseudomonadota bacterium]
MSAVAGIDPAVSPAAPPAAAPAETTTGEAPAFPALLDEARAPSPAVATRSPLPEAPPLPAAALPVGLPATDAGAALLAQRAVACRLLPADASPAAMPSADELVDDCADHCVDAGPPAGIVDPAVVALPVPVAVIPAAVSVPASAVGLPSGRTPASAPVEVQMPGLPAGQDAAPAPFAMPAVVAADPLRASPPASGDALPFLSAPAALPPGSAGAAPAAAAFMPAQPSGPLATPVSASGLLLPADTPPGLQARTDFSDAVGARLTWLAGQQIGRAEIMVSPPDMGPISVQLEIDGKHVRAEFQSAQADVRAALEAGVPRLREMLSGQGLLLDHAGVGHGGANDHGHMPSGRQPAQEQASSSPDDANPAPPGTVSAHRLERRGLLDEYV